MGKVLETLDLMRPEIESRRGGDTDATCESCWTPVSSSALHVCKRIRLRVGKCVHSRKRERVAGSMVLQIRYLSECVTARPELAKSICLSSNRMLAGWTHGPVNIGEDSQSIEGIRQRYVDAGGCVCEA